MTAKEIYWYVVLNVVIVFGIAAVVLVNAPEAKPRAPTIVHATDTTCPVCGCPIKVE